MILIGEKIDLNSLAEKHWNWLKKKINYDSTEKKTYSECQSALSDPKKKEREKKECALKVILGKDLYSKLEDIIKAPLNELKRIKEKNPFFFLDETSIQNKKKELDDLTVQLRTFEKNKTFSEDNIITKLKEQRKKKYEEYISFKNSLENELEQRTSTTYIKGDKEIQVSLLKLLRYENLHNRNTDWNANILCNSLNMSVCPYCNRQYIYTTKKIEGGWISSAQLDHYFPKDCNPLFSCSFFNLIPSCYCCNHGKSDDLRETIHPYTQQFEDNGIFAIEFSDEIPVENIDFQKDIDITIDVKPCSNKTLITNSINVFHLKELYKMHQLDLKDLIKRFNCCKECRQHDYNNINLQTGTWDNSRKRELILGLPLDAGNSEYPLRKMKFDILDQLEKIEHIKL